VLCCIYANLVELKVYKFAVLAVILLVVIDVVTAFDNVMLLVVIAILALEIATFDTV
jgi:hypothetical protein